MSQIINLHRKNTSNRGDIASGPLQYLSDAPEWQSLDITGWKQADESRRANWLALYNSAKLIVVGGGGLLEFDKHADSLDFISSTGSAKRVIWGAGHNISAVASWSRLKPRYNNNFSNFDLVGIRDYGHSFEWVPCASCLSPLLDNPPPPTKEFTFFANNGINDSSLFHPAGIDTDQIVTNLKTPLENVIAELAAGETVVTSSFHGAYWATLLGRKVVGIPTSSKFYDLRHPIPLCHRSDWRRFLSLARTYPDALEECRAANQSFYQRVLNLL